MMVAIKRIGTNGLPWLIAGLQRRDSTAVDFYNLKIWRRLPSWLQARLGKPRHPAHDRLNAAYALGLLGSEAKPAVPQLKRLLSDSNAFVRAAALESLQQIDPAEVGLFHPEIFENPQPVSATSSSARSVPPKAISDASTNLEALTYDTHKPGRKFPEVDAIEPLWRLKDVGLLPETPSSISK